MRWLEMSEPCSVNLQYNGLHTCLASVCVTVHAGVWVQGHIAWVPVFMSSILPAGEGTISTLKKPLITSGYIPVSAIHQVHLSESGSFKSLPVCFIYRLFTARRKRYSYRWKLMLLLWRPFYRYLPFQLSDHSIFTVLLPQTNNLTVKAVGLPSQAFCLRLALLRMRGWGWGCFDIRALFPPLLISPNKREARPHTWQGVIFHLWKTVKF